MAEFWWRSWHGAPMDHKWAVIAARSGVKAGIVSAIAWELLDYASQNEDRGSIDGFDIEEYSIYSGFSEDEISAVINAMIDKGIIKDNRFVNWGKRQPKSESAIERNKKYRSMTKNNNSTIDSNDIQIATECYDALQNATVCYSLLQDATENCIDTDTDTDKDKELKDLKDCDSKKIESRSDPEELDFFPFEEDFEKEKLDSIPQEQIIPEKKIKEYTAAAKKAAPAEKKRKEPTDPTYWDFLGPNKQAGIAFYEAAKLVPVRSEFGKWAKGFQELAEAGITPEEIPKIVTEMRKQGLTIKAPQSILAIGRDMKAKQSTVRNDLEGWTFR
ncbi:MAG TPA: hypothetical protein PKX37_10760 [Flexilinea sp.]|nr:hypothetical protein [Flexilinea sp.]